MKISRRISPILHDLSERQHAVRLHFDRERPTRRNELPTGGGKREVPVNRVISSCVLGNDDAIVSLSRRGHGARIYSLIQIKCGVSGRSRERRPALCAHSKAITYLGRVYYCPIESKQYERLIDFSNSHVLCPSHVIHRSLPLSPSCLFRRLPLSLPFSRFPIAQLGTLLADHTAPPVEVATIMDSFISSKSLRLPRPPATL